MTAQAPPMNGAAPRSERRERHLRRWRRRSALIGVLRVALPAAMVAIILLLAAWVAFGGMIASLGGQRGAGPGSIHMTNARFLGRDADGRPYVLTALEAARDNLDFQRITLQSPTLTLGADGPKAVHLTADRGVYREDNRILLLNGHVSLRDSQGDAFLTDQAIVDTLKGAVAGKSPIAGHGPAGAIRADSYAVYDRGQRLVFQGRVHSRVNPH
jgi:lipopolysaccharide export system protein LptC